MKETGGELLSRVALTLLLFSPGGGASDFSASFGVDQVLDLTNSPGFRYRLEDFTVTAAVADTPINFVGSSQLFWLIDDVAVTPAPEPAGLGLLAAALFGLGAAYRLGKRRASSLSHREARRPMTPAQPKA